jgi:hypothetical protein
MDGVSLIRYGGGSFKLRQYFIKLCAWLQRKPVLIFDQDPLLCSSILANSDKKGSFVEHLFAIPAWNPIYSIESEDGARWKILSMNCCQVFRTLRWKESLSPQVDSCIRAFAVKINEDPSFVINAEYVSRSTLRIIYQLLFEHPIAAEDETLFYNASLEWRKEIALKGLGDVAVKQAFCLRLFEIIKQSRFSEGLNQEHNREDPTLWISVFAQPFILSPQINVSDIMVSVFLLLRQDPLLYELTRKKAHEGDESYLNAVIMESIRLQHPFPVLERELCSDMIINGNNISSGTQIIMIIDQFVHSTVFDPQTWLGEEKNNFEGLIFGAGKRICLGKTLAKALMVDMLKSMLTHIPDIKIQPGLGHLYSGRDNDHKSSLNESVYQIKLFGRALWRSYIIGCKKKAKNKPVAQQNIK